MNYNVNNENERIIIGEVGENLAESCTIDYSAWVEEYGEGNLRIRAIREGDAEPYPVANVETADGLATWTYTAADTAVKGFGEVQVLYYVGDVLAKSRVWKTYTYRSLNTSSEEVPDPYADWLNAVERIGGQVESDAEAASASADSASASATLAAGSASEAAESALSASRSASAALGSAGAASSSAESAASSATAASRSATEASNYEYYSEQYMNEAKSAKFGAESARTGAENAKAAAQASATAAAQSAAQAEEAAESIEESADLIQKLLANQIHDTATGTIATYPDGADMPMVSLIADIDPIQDLHGYDRPWVGGVGKNKFPLINGGTNHGITAVTNSDGSVTLNGTASGNGVFFTDYFTVKAGEYIITGNKPNNDAAVYLNGVSGSASEGARLTIPEDISVRGAVQVYDGKTVSNYTVYPMLRLATETDATYAPYSNICPISGWDSVDVVVSPTQDSQDGTTITTTFPQTVYGGTLDVVSGVLTVDRAMVTFDGTNNVNPWKKSGSALNGYYTDMVANMGNLAMKWVSRIASPIITDKFKYTSSSNTYFNNYGYTYTDYTIGFNVDPAIAGNTVDSFKAWLAENPVQVVYELATPQTITLTPTQIDSLLGRNNVWADSGDVTVEYIADTKLYIQKVIS